MAFTSRAVTPSGGSFPPFKTVRVSLSDLARLLDFAANSHISNQDGTTLSIHDQSWYSDSYSRLDRAFSDAIRTGWRVRK